MKSHTPNREEKEWMDLITQIGCIVCLMQWDVQTPAEVHHIEGKTEPGSHLKTIPLCYAHHRAGKDTPAWVSRHPYKAKFEERYGTEEELYERTKKEVSRHYYGSR